MQPGLYLRWLGHGASFREKNEDSRILVTGMNVFKFLSKTRDTIVSSILLHRHILANKINFSRTEVPHPVFRIIRCFPAEHKGIQSPQHSVQLEQASCLFLPFTALSSRWPAPFKLQGART